MAGHLGWHVWRVVKGASLYVFLVIILLALPVGADEPAPSCDDLAQGFYDECARLQSEAARLNCEERDGYSGCAVDVISCRDRVWNTAFRDCEAPGYVECAQAASEQYLACLEDCNYQVRNVETYAQHLEVLRSCGADCFSPFEDAIFVCRQAACDPGCVTEGHAGGTWIPRTGCECYDDPTATSLPTDIPAPTATPMLAPTPMPTTTTASTQDEGDSAFESSSEQDLGVSGAGNPEGGKPLSSSGGIAEGSEDQSSAAGAAPSESSAEPEKDWWEGALDDEAPGCVSFRMRPVSAWSVGEIIGYTRVTYELQEVLDDGTTGRRCMIQFSGWGLTLGLPLNAHFAPGYQWTEFDTSKGRMRLEEFDGIKGYHSSGGALVYGVGGFTFGDANSTWNKQAQSQGTSWNVGVHFGADWMFGSWKITEPPR